MKLTDNWQTTVLEDENGAIVILNARLDLQEFKESGKMKYCISISYPYEAIQKGMPEKEDEEIISQVDQLLRRAMEKDKLAILSSSSLGAGEKHWVFYARTEKVFFERLNEVLEPLPLLPLKFECVIDPEWEEYAEMLDLALEGEE